MLTEIKFLNKNPVWILGARFRAGGWACAFGVPPAPSPIPKP